MDLKLADPRALARRAVFDGLRPEPPLAVWQWADRYRRLAQKASPNPGRWDTDRTPFWRELMECLSAISPTRKIVLMKAAQVGGTEIGYNWIGYTIDWDPCAMMLVQPTVEGAKANSKTRIAPMIEESPRLKRKVRDARSRDSGNTVQAKEFDGGLLAIVGANSAVSLRNRPIKKLMLDEVDGYPLNVDGEGDPATLAEVRTTNFPRRKVYYVSTPTIEGRSRIEKEYEKSDRRRFNVPCPHCGFEQVLIWSQLKWPENNPRKAYYVCPDCGKEIQEKFKKQMLARGRWIAERPGAQAGEVAGFHINALYSPLGWKSWGELAVEFIEAGEDPEKLKVFVNTRLGETWREKGEAPEWQRLYHMRESYEIGTVPKGAVFLTMGIDVQNDRLEYEVVGWGPRKESWSIYYGVIEGDIADEKIWPLIDEALARQYPREGGSGYLPIRMAAIDTGFKTNHVYTFARRHSIQKLLPVKGQDALPLVVGRASPVDINIHGRTIKRGIRVFPVGVSVVKSELYAWLRLEKPTKEDVPFPGGYCHFPQYDDKYFEMLTAEELVMTTRKGFKKYEWRKIRARNEALDVRVYARAAASVLGIDRFTDKHWREMGATQITSMKPAESPKKPEAVSDQKPDAQPPRRASPQKKARRRSNFW